VPRRASGSASVLHATWADSPGCQSRWAPNTVADVPGHERATLDDAGFGRSESSLLKTIFSKFDRAAAAEQVERPHSDDGTGALGALLSRCCEKMHSPGVRGQVVEVGGKDRGASEL